MSIDQLEKKKHIKDLKAGELVHIKAAVKFKKPPREYAKGYRLISGDLTRLGK